MKIKNLFVSFLIILLLTLHVMPFNILKADSQTDNFGKIALTSGVPQQIATKDNGDPYYVTVTGANSYMYGYYTHTDTARMSVLSLENITLSPSSWNEVEHISVNDYSFYMTTYMSSISNYDPKYYIPDFPKYTENNLDIPNTGDYAFNFLGAQAYLGTTKYNANQSFYSWTVGNNPYTITCSTDVYVVAFSYSGTYIVYFFVQEPNATLTFTRASSNNVSPVYGSTTYKGVNLYYYTVSSWSYNPTNYTYGWNTNVFRNLNNRSTFPNPLHSAYNIYLYDTYEEPVPPVQYGDVVCGFYTKYAGSGGSDDLTWRENVDVIQWSNYDSLGQYINDYGLIEIRPLSGYFTSSSRSSLILQAFNDFILDDIDPELTHRTYLLNPSDMEFTREWGNMVDDYTSDIPFFTLTNYYRNNAWYKHGWIWQIRIVDKDDPSEPLTEWQTIYNTTSYSGNDVWNSPTLNTDTYDQFQEINNTNNVTNNYWYINNVPVDVDNDTPISDGSWIEKLIESIADLIGTIVQSVSDIIKAIAGFGSDIIQGIFDLISDLGVNILDTFTNLWNGFIDLFNGIDFSDDNPNYDLDLDFGEDNTPLRIVPAFLEMIFGSGIGYIIWIPLIIGIISLIL